jgi:hypothetical protein
MEHNTQLFTYTYQPGFRRFFRNSVLILTKNWLLATLPNSGGDPSEADDWAAPQNEGHKFCLATHHNVQQYYMSETDNKMSENKKQ